jgi:glycosyltransferase involved in cell wall biosynthesis
MPQGGERRRRCFCKSAKSLEYEVHDTIEGNTEGVAISVLPPESCSIGSRGRRFIMLIWRDGDALRALARKLPPWVKRPARQLLNAVDQIWKRLGFSVAAGLVFPRSGIVAGRETIVLIVHEATRTGAPILAWNLLCELQKKYNVVVLLRRGGAIKPAFDAAAAAVICLPDHFSMRAAEVEALASKILDVYAPKYAIANSVESRYFVPDLEALGIPVVGLIHEFSSTYMPLGTLYGLFSTASNIVFPAQIVADAAVADYNILEARDFKILPQGQSRLPSIESSDPGGLRPLESNKGRPGLAGEGFRVVGVGTITMRKGVDFFIAVAAEAKKILPDHRLSFAWVGTHYAFDQPYFDSLTEQIERSDLGDRFQFVGELDDLDPVYDDANIMFLASRLDPLPNVAIDSALRGLPIVCFDQASGIAEILSEYDETRDLIVPHFDCVAAAQLICSLATDAARLGKLSAVVAEVGRQRFDMKNYIRKIDELGLRSRHSLDQMQEDLKTIRRNEAFNFDLNLGYESGSMNADQGVLKYLRGSRLAAPWNKPRAGLFIRRPLPGFNPLIYASDNTEFDAQGLEDPLAHFARSGRPCGRWTHRVIKPSAKGVSRRPGEVAIHGHFHYPELLPDFISRLSRNANTFDLFLTTTSHEKAKQLADIISKFELTNVAIATGENRGRDFAPFLQGLSEGRYFGYDVVGHFHSKRSPHVDASTGDIWRKFLWEHLIGGESAMADTILEVFAEDERLGLVFAEDPNLNGWDENLKIAESLATQMKLAQPLPMHFDFPIGTMFWARPAALMPFTRLNVGYDEFPSEPLPIDGTLLHALERLIPFAAADAGFGYATTYVKDSKR